MNVKVLGNLDLKKMISENEDRFLFLFSETCELRRGLTVLGRKNSPPRCGGKKRKVPFDCGTGGTEEVRNRDFPLFQVP